MKTLIGIATFGGVDFTRLAVKSVQETVKNDYDFFIVIGKPGDTATQSLIESIGASASLHGANWGFPRAVNDIYEHAWVTNDYDNVVIMGNDVIAYPYAIDSLIDTTKDHDYDWVCSTQYDVRMLIAQFPEARKDFSGGAYKFTQFNSKAPWELFTGYREERQIAEIGLSDVQNLCLYTRNAFDQLGYTDVNYYPAYYIDNDYARRGVNLNIKSCTLINSMYFHFWSRTIHQGSGGSTPVYFSKNQNFYIKKWGGDFGKETYQLPFNGTPYQLTHGVTLEPTLNISSRDNELKIIDYWMRQ